LQADSPEEFIKGTDRILQINDLVRTPVQAMPNQSTAKRLSRCFGAGKEHCRIPLLKIITQILQDIFSPGLSKKYVWIRFPSERRVFETKVLEIHYSIYKKKSYAKTVTIMTWSTSSPNCSIDTCIISA
jgi:hypothetical protein